ncbi:hypothetical protein ACHAXT_001750 [Thalassiosira profunda]
MPPKKKAAAKAKKAAAAPKSSMEESADALAGVEGALGKAAKDMPRSNSMKDLAEVAGALLRDQAVPAAVPDPIAAAAALPVPAAAAVPTGFRKKGSAKVPAAVAAAAAASRPSAESADGKPKKSQIQYNPDVPMTKEQLTAWRREMRRVRNRESAAASRRKVRDRIEELEEEVAVWKRRYEEVMNRLGGKAEGGGKKKRAKTEGEGQV